MLISKGLPSFKECTKAEKEGHFLSVFQEKEPQIQALITFQYNEVQLSLRYQNIPWNLDNKFQSISLAETRGKHNFFAIFGGFSDHVFLLLSSVAEYSLVTQEAGVQIPVRANSLYYLCVDFFSGFLMKQYLLGLF